MLRLTTAGRRLVFTAVLLGFDTPGEVPLVVAPGLADTTRRTSRMHSKTCTRKMGNTTPSRRCAVLHVPGRR